MPNQTKYAPFLLIFASALLSGGNYFVHKDEAFENF